MTMFHRVRPLGGLVDKTFEDVIVDRDILVEALLTCANLAQNKAVNAEVEGALKAVGITMGHVHTDSVTPCEECGVGGIVGPVEEVKRI